MNNNNNLAQKAEHQIYNELINTIKCSDSLKILQENVVGKLLGSTFHHHAHILYDIRTLLGKEKKVYLEIGSYCGGSACFMLQHHFETEIHCVDPLNLPKQRFKLDMSQEEILCLNLSALNINDRKFFIHKNFSTDLSLVEKLKKDNIKIDILFIDGAHDYKTVVSDFKLFSPFVNSGGFIVFDDYLDFKWSPQVRKAVDDIVKNIIMDIDTKYAIIGLLPNIKEAFTNIKRPNLNEFILIKK